MIGFGPSAISFSTYPGPKGGSYRVKIVNPDSSEDYIGAVAKTPTVWNRWFIYGPRDLQIVYLTRRLAALNIERSAYRTLFDSDPLDDFPSECEAMTTESLVEIDNARIRPTPRGMFYADSIAVLWAWKRVQNKRAHALNESRVSSMG
jgi:oxygen-independent coproporphyrinogen-3 oxidase